jgi:hypothetical protein
MEASQIIAEVARSTGVRLDKSDPILAAAVVHEALLTEALVKLDRQVTIQADRVTSASTQTVVDAKKVAELLVTDAGVWIEERMKAAGEAAATLVLAELRRETQAAQTARHTMVRAAWLMVVICLTAVSAASGIALASLR